MLTHPFIYIFSRASMLSKSAIEVLPQAPSLIVCKLLTLAMLLRAYTVSPRIVLMTRTNFYMYNVATLTLAPRRQGSKVEPTLRVV